MLLAGVSILALGVNSLTKFIAIRGALLASLLVFTIPAIIGLASVPGPPRGPRAGLTSTDDKSTAAQWWTAPRLALAALGVYGLASSVLGTAAALR